MNKWRKYGSVLLVTGMLVNQMAPGMSMVYAGTVSGHSLSIKATPSDATASDAEYDPEDEPYYEDVELENDLELETEVYELASVSNAVLKEADEEILSEEFFLEPAGSAGDGANGGISLFSSGALSEWSDGDTLYRDQLPDIETVSNTDGISDIYDIFEEHFGELEINMGQIGEFESEASNTDPEVKEQLQDIYLEYGSKLQIARDAFVYDHPEMFWGSELSYQFSTRMVSNYDFTGFEYRVSCKIKFNIDMTEAQVATMLKEEQDAADEIVDSLPSMTDSYNQLAALYQVLAEQLSYDYTLNLTYSHDAYGALVGNIDASGNDAGTTVVCEGYAKAYKVICDLLEIPCVLIIGEGNTGRASDAHMWNYVKMDDGNWYALDLTWDDVGRIADTEYFLVGSDTLNENNMAFSESHEEDGVFSADGWEFAYPQLEAEKYEPRDYNLERLTLPQEISIVRGENAVLEAEAEPEQTDLLLFWLSSDESVAQVDKNGTVTALAVGEAEITVRAVNGVSTSCLVTVLPNELDKRMAFVESIYLNLLGRLPNAAERSGLEEQLVDGTAEMTAIIGSVVSSAEFKQRNLSERTFAESLWGIFCDVDEAESEIAEAERVLKLGVSELYVVKMLSETEQFLEVCETQKIAAGSVVLTENRDQNLGITTFISNCYSGILGRKTDAGGLNYWTGEVRSGKVSGAMMVARLMESAEFKKGNPDSTKQIKALYLSMMGREADGSGLAYWVEELDSGVSIRYLINRMAGSSEFRGACQDSGIDPGKLTLTENRDKNIKVTRFVTRCYQNALGRKGDASGLNSWTGVLLNKTKTPKTVAKNFVFSGEATKKNLNNTEFVKMLYRLYMGREADKGGLNYWVGRLQNGTSRQKVADSMAASKEFTEIVKSYGL